MPKHFALIPAAGSGSRLGGGLPKQYQVLAGQSLLHHSVARLCAHPLIEQVFVVLAPGDTRFRQFDWSTQGSKVEPLYCGGETRAASVFNGLLAAYDAFAAEDWVLVHDAARPCLGAAPLDRLIAELADDAIGGLLAVPVADTLKRGNAEGRVVRTEPRDSLWLAQTPQMFRYRLLVEALRAVDLATITDEAGAIEQLGLRPKIVRGDSRNLKVTYAEDLALAEVVLKSMDQPPRRQDAKKT